MASSVLAMQRESIYEGYGRELGSQRRNSFPCRSRMDQNPFDHQTPEVLNPLNISRMVRFGRFELVFALKPRRASKLLIMNTTTSIILTSDMLYSPYNQCDGSFPPPKKMGSVNEV